MNNSKVDTAKWHNRLRDIPCFIIGNGPSLNEQLPEEKVYLLENYFTLGINRSFYRIDTNILMWQDMSLWMKERKKIEKLKAMKFCRDRSDVQKKFFHFKLKLTTAQLPKDPSTLYGRGSSGVIAFEFAYALGCDPIILLGMDCLYESKKITDFYGKNTMHRSRTLPDCVWGLKWIKKCQSGRNIINCSNNEVFEKKINLEDALKEINKKEKWNRKYFEKKIMKKCIKKEK